MRIIHLANRHHDKPSAGHGFWLNHQYKNSCEQNGAEFLLVAPKVSVDPESYPLLALSRKSRERLTHFPLFGIGADLKNLRRLISSNSEETILHVYEGGLREFLIVVKLASEATGLKTIFNFNLSDPWHTAAISQTWMSKHIWRLIYEATEDCEGSVVFTAETKELASLLNTRINTSLKEYVLVPNVPFEQVSPINPKHWDFFVPVFGEGELDLLLDALFELRRRTGKSHRVRIQPRWSQPLSTESVSRLNELGVELLPEIVSEEVYINTVSSSCTVVLPYLNLDYYRLQSSGRVMDAVALGARVVVPATTSLSRQVLERSWGHEFNPKSHQSLSEAMEMSLGEKADVQSRFSVMSAYQSIVSQAASADPLKRVSQRARLSAKGMWFRFTASSLLFLVSDFRSFVSGILGLMNIPPKFLTAYALKFPRKHPSNTP